MLQEFKNIRAIYPPTPGIIACGCYSCGKDVKLDVGFVDMTKQPFKGYLCANCANMAISGNKCSELLAYAQEIYRKSKG